jgi:carboxyl-terminal processing protease
MSFKTRLLILLISTPLVLFVGVGGLLGASAPPAAAGQQAFADLRLFGQIVQLITSSYVEPVDVDKVMDGAMRGLADGLDPSSAYLLPEEKDAIEAGTPLPPAGVGLVVTRQFYLRVVGVEDGSPAAKAGLRTGDYIRMIDGKPTRDMSALTGTRLLRGAAGSAVKVLILRGNAADPHEVALVRASATGAAVASRKLPGGETYVRVTRFAKDAPATLKQIADAAQKDGSSGLIIDLRGTADGAPADGVAAARYFVKNGTIATLAGRDNKTVTMAGPADGAVTLPTVLLVSNGTANAAEVFAAALQGNSRASLVGEPTAGIAASQRLVKLPDNRALWMTTERYTTSTGQPIHEHGLRPDVGVAEPSVPFGETPATTDDALAKAVEQLKVKKAQ